jgi:hypothetical protein
MTNSLIATDRELHNVANALAEQTAWTWQAVDFLLRDTARWYQNDSHDIAPERLDDVLATRAAGVPQVRLITIADAQGIQRYRSRGSSPPEILTSPTAHISSLSEVACCAGPLHERTLSLALREPRGSNSFAPSR